MLLADGEIPAHIRRIIAIDYRSPFHPLLAELGKDQSFRQDSPTFAQSAGKTSDRNPGLSASETILFNLHTGKWLS
jgi:hypothetical protein